MCAHTHCFVVHLPVLLLSPILFGYLPPTAEIWTPWAHSSISTTLACWRRVEGNKVGDGSMVSLKRKLGTSLRWMGLWEILGNSSMIFNGLTVWELGWAAASERPKHTKPCSGKPCSVAQHWKISWIQTHDIIRARIFGPAPYVSASRWCQQMRCFQSP